MSLAQSRLQQERKNWRRDHPKGFYARPRNNPDGSIDMFTWDCGIPGKAKTDWENGIYTLTIEFSEDYPTKPPKCMFKPVLFHPNIYPSGTVCLSILDENKAWRPSITVKQILLGIQDLLDEPNENDPAQSEPLKLFLSNKEEYNRRIRKQVLDFPPP